VARSTKGIVAAISRTFTDTGPTRGASARRQNRLRAASIWHQASNDNGGEPDVVLGAASDIPH
jgi:phosphoketolase